MLTDLEVTHLVIRKITEVMKLVGQTPAMILKRYHALHDFYWRKFILP